jgi:hypothetical protein
MRRWLLTLAICSAAVLAASQASRAELLQLESTGAFGPATTLGGTPLGADTNYSFRAVFDSTKNRNPIVGENGAGYFSALEFALTIEGHGAFEGIPSDDLNVVLLDPDYHLGIHAAGLLSADGQRFFLDSYAKVEPTFDARSPVPTVFVDYLTTAPGFPYQVLLVGVDGGLVINDIGGGARSAIVKAVPEPSTVVLMVIGLATFGWHTLARVNDRGSVDAAKRRGHVFGESPSLLAGG